jgi:hypothetical protein
VLVEQALRDAGRGGDVLHLGQVEPALPELVEGDREQLLTPRRRGESASR